MTKTIVETKTRTSTRRLRRKLKKQADTSSQLIAIKVPKDNLAEFDSICKEHQVSRSKMIRSLIAELLAA